MKKSNETFTDAMKSVGESMKLLSQSMANSMQALASCLSPAQPMFYPISDLIGNVLQQRPLMAYYNSPQLHNSAPLHNERNIKFASAMNMPGREERSPPYQEHF